MRVRARSSVLPWLLLVLTLPALAATSHRQNRPAAAVSAAFLSDPHFDPFRDPAKVKRLEAAPVSEWEDILAEAPAPDAADKYAGLQQACKAKGLDAEHDLLQSSFAAAAVGTGSRPTFVLLAGDLLVHNFDCRYRQLLGDTPGGLERFAGKTLQYVVLQLEAHFPQTPVYVALGNNDSGCGDYQLDPSSAFLDKTAQAMREGWRSSSSKETAKAEAEYLHLGSYSLPLAAPLVRTRIVVLDDIFLAASYRGCDGKPHPEHAEALLQWLDQTLRTAKDNGEQVWVLTHVPPGVNVYSTFLRATEVCAGAAPAMFLSSEGLAEVLTRYASTVRLVVAGHTHVDEMHVLGEDRAPEQQVAVKSVPSITPLSGNGPEFLTATLDPFTARLVDYKLQHADADSGPKIQWKESYDYGGVYGQKQFDASAVAQLIQRFGSNETVDAAMVANYQQHYTTGLKRLALQAVWPQYLCSMHHDTAKGFAECSCQKPAQ